MQKKLIALAVAGLVSVPAFAQSNVTIYGVVDMGYSYRGDNVNSDVKNRNGIDSGISGGSRLGFRGTEDLGNGLKAGFVLEQGIDVDTGNSEDTVQNRTFGRQSFVSLSGGFGTVALGRQYTPAHALLAGNIDPFGLGKGTVGSIANFYVSESRLDNLAAYVSPNWGGFSFVAGYTFNANLNEQTDRGATADNETDVRAWTIAPTYKNGPLYVGLNFHRLDPVLDTANDFRSNSTNVWDLGATYDFGMVKVGAVYGQRKQSDVYKVKQWALTAAVPVGAAGKVQLGYGQRKTTDEGFFGGNADDAKVSQWALGYEHALSKRTALYATYAQQNQNDEQEVLSSSATLAGVTHGLGAGVGDASNAGAGYQRGFNLGVRHSF